MQNLAHCGNVCNNEFTILSYTNQTAIKGQEYSSKKSQIIPFNWSKVLSTSVKSLHLFSFSHSPSPPHPDRVIDLIRHWVRLHYAVLTDKRKAKQLFSFPLSPPRGCVSKRRTSLPGQISLFILIQGLQYWLHFIGSEISHQWSALRLLVLSFS